MIRLRVYGAIAVTAIGLYLVGRWQGAASVADAAVIQRAEDATSATVRKAYHGTQAKLLAVEQQGQRAIQLSKRLADSLRARALRVDTVITSDSGPVSLWRATANASREEATQCGLALATCQERAQTAEARAQALDSLLGNVLKTKDCHILWVRCPSRTATGLLGLGLGFAGGLLVTR